VTSTVKPYLSEEDYLTEERTASFKSEYYKGEVFAMSGTTKEHKKIAGAIVGELYAHLKGKSCAVMPSDIRVYNPANTLYTYPDAVVVCEEEKYLDNEFDTLLNPTIIIEILSKSTQDYDRGTKFFLYRSIPSLQHYVLINSLEFGIEIFTRDGEQWILTSANALEDELYLSAIDFRFKVKDMYAQVMNLLPKQNVIQ
jgi:Uma2 family endonuclease